MKRWEARGVGTSSGQVLTHLISASGVPTRKKNRGAPSTEDISYKKGMAELGPAMPTRQAPAGPPLSSLMGKDQIPGGGGRLGWGQCPIAALGFLSHEALLLQFCGLYNVVRSPSCTAAPYTLATLWKQPGGRSFGHTRNTTQLQKRTRQPSTHCSGPFPQTG